MKNLLRKTASSIIKKSSFTHELTIFVRQYIARRMRTRLLNRNNYTVVEQSKCPRLSEVQIDIFIPAVEKDLVTLRPAVKFARLNVLHPVRRIFVVSPASEKIEALCREEQCDHINELDLLSLAKKDVSYIVGDRDLSGWLLQQLLKLSPERLPDVQKYLVLDADTILIRPQTFERGGKWLFNFSDEYHHPYFKMYERLFGREGKCPVSFVAHHMLFQSSIVMSLRRELELRHGKVWYEAIRGCLDKLEPSGFSEYETYAQYALSTIGPEIAVEYWHNRSFSRSRLSELAFLARKYASRYKSISFHSWNTKT